MLRIASMLRQFFVVLKKKCVSFVCMCMPKHGITHSLTLSRLSHMCNTNQNYFSSRKPKRHSRSCAKREKKEELCKSHWEREKRQNTIFQYIKEKAWKFKCAIASLSPLKGMVINWVIMSNKRSEMCVRMLLYFISVYFSLCLSLSL